MAFNYCPSCGSGDVWATGKYWGKGDERECHSCGAIHHVCYEGDMPDEKIKEIESDGDVLQKD